jgi:hypothetical protein
MSDQEMGTEDLRRALEALRNGVPNRDAVAVLGCGQTHVTDRFQKQLEQLDESFSFDRQAKGLLVAGDFGSGKSHLLEYLKHLALEANFVCSLIVISKETPLYDPVKVFAAAAEGADAPRITGDAIQEIALRLDPHSSDYAEFFRWADSPASGISSIFPATLLLHERLGNDPERSEQIRNFWAGANLPLADVRSGLRQIGQAAAYQFRVVPAKTLPVQRFKFVSRMARAAGYRGWVLLIDEVELIGRYSRLQRAKSYAEIARWMGLDESAHNAGLTAVAAITVDFDAKILVEKGDRELVAPLLERRDTDDFRAIASRAETGMREIERGAIPLNSPDAEMLSLTYETLKRIHADAYGWSPGELPSSRTSITRQMRSYVRRWINEWDLQRLYPGETLLTVETELTMDYSEVPELEQASEDSSNDAFSDL